MPRFLFQKNNMQIQKELILLLEEIAKKHNASISQVAIKWTMEQAGMTSAIIGTQNQKHFLDNLRAFEVVLSGEELRQIDEVSKRVIAGMSL